MGRKVPWIKEVNDRHVARNGVPITEDAACYYQCFQVLVDALERSKELDPKKIRDAIAATDITDPNHKAMFVPVHAAELRRNRSEPDGHRDGRAGPAGQAAAGLSAAAAEPDVTPIWPYARKA